MKLTEVLTTLRVAASIQILEGKLDLQPQEALLYAQPVSNTFRYLGNPEKSLRNYVVPGAIANIVQLTMYMFLVEAIRKDEDEKGTSIALLFIGQSAGHRCFTLLCLADAQLRYPHAGRVEYHCPVGLFQYVWHRQSGGYPAAIAAG